MTITLFTVSVAYLADPLERPHGDGVHSFESGGGGEETDGLMESILLKV